MLILYCFFTSAINKPKLYHGQDCSSFASIYRVGLTNTILRLDLPKSFILYGGDSVNTINYSDPIHLNPGNEIPDTPFSSGRKYFQLVTNEGKCLLSEKHPPVEYNFRDLGGIPTKDGRHVKWGKFFRIDQPSGLDPDEINYLKSIPVNVVVDFRSQGEADSKPDSELNAVYRPLRIDLGNLGPLVDKMMSGETLTIEEVKTAMKGMYHDLVTDPPVVEKYRQFFELLQNPSSLPLLFHCTAGKDRTGTAAYLILSSLGVGLDEIFKDYLLTNEYYLPHQGVDSSNPLYYLMGVNEEYLQTEINTIKNTYGTVERYLADTLNVNLTLMKEIYLD